MLAAGVGIVTCATRDGSVLEAFFPRVWLGSAPPDAAEPELTRREDPERGVTLRVERREIDLAAPPADAVDAYLRLHLLSERLVAPNELDVSGIFGVLQTVAWTELGAVHVADLPALRLARRRCGRPLRVHAVDKFPAMLDFVSPPEVRIADAARVRLGAHLAAGTVVMQTGLVNYNAGTLGPAMVEGRITQGTVVEGGADIGAGASTMGTLSGGGSARVRVGAGSLIGANAGTGVALGPDCAVEAGLYLTRGTRVTLPDGSVVKAADLAGRPNLLFRRESTTGRVEALPWRTGSFAGLNADLHGGPPQPSDPPA